MNIKYLPTLKENNSSLPKYIQIALLLEEFLKNNPQEKNSKFFTDRALAKHFKSTTVTIARSLNVLVEKNMLERRIGSGTFVCYSAANPQLKRRIGVFCHEVIAMDSIYIYPIMHAFNQYYLEQGYKLISFYCQPQEWLKLIKEFELDGVMILVPRDDFAEHIIKLRQQNYPAVSIGYAFPELAGIAFGTNHTEATCRAIDYLYDLGHRRIGLLTDSKFSSSSARVRGYNQAMWKHRLPTAPDWIISSGNFGRNVQQMKMEFTQVFNSPDRPTALLLDNVFDIFSVYQFAKLNGLQIPQDLTVIGFDDADFLEYIDPPLTVMGQDLHAISVSAACKLQNMIEQKDINNTESTVSPYKILERKSCIPIKQ